jgi:membrane protein involved in colicin uptake
MGSNIKGAGDNFGLSGSGNGGFVGVGGNGAGSGNPYARYASQIQSRIAEVLRQDKRTRAAAYRAKVKLWLDSNGTVTRAEPTEGNDGGAAAALVGVKMLDGLPQGMPMPVKTQINSVRP